MHARQLIALLALLLSLNIPEAVAQTPEEKGYAIAAEADRRDTGFGDYVADLEMVLRNRHGEESRRRLRVSNLEVGGDDKSLVLFDEPADVKGTALLTYTYKTAQDDDQWLYLPALKRVKRIASANKSGSFVGSEFSYEDIRSQELEKYTYKFLREEIHQDVPCFVIERYPVSRYSGYTREVVRLDQTEHRARKVEFYDRKNTLLKTLTWDGYRQYLGKYWRADRMLMENHQSGKSTLLMWSNYRFRTGMRETDFTQASLKRQR